MSSTGFYWVLLFYVGFYRVFLGFIGLYWVVLGCTGLYWVLLGFTGFYRVLLACPKDAPTPWTLDLGHPASPRRWITFLNGRVSVSLRCGVPCCVRLLFCCCCCCFFLCIARQSCSFLSVVFPWHATTAAAIWWSMAAISANPKAPLSLDRVEGKAVDFEAPWCLFVCLFVFFVRLFVGCGGRHLVHSSADGGPERLSSKRRNRKKKWRLALPRRFVLFFPLWRDALLLEMIGPKWNRREGMGPLRVVSSSHWKQRTSKR